MREPVQGARARPLPLLVTFALAGTLVAGVSTAGPARAAVGDLFTAELTGGAEVPEPGPDGATGTATLASYLDRVEICYEITFEGLPPEDVVTAAHIHLGEAGVAGDIVLELFSEPPTEDPIFGCVQDFDPGIQDDLLANPGSYYVNVHTQAYPDGAVRGQLQLTSQGITCPITVEPEIVAVGQEFVVSGDFGGYAEVHLVPGADSPLPDDSTPAATLAEGEYPLSITFTAAADDVGDWTAWALRPETRGCAGSANLTIVQPPPDTAMTSGTPWVPAVVGALLLALGALAGVIAAQRGDASLADKPARPKLPRIT